MVIEYEGGYKYCVNESPETVFEKVRAVYMAHFDKMDCVREAWCETYMIWDVFRLIGQDIPENWNFEATRMSHNGLSRAISYWEAAMWAWLHDEDFMFPPKIVSITWDAE